MGQTRGQQSLKSTGERQRKKRPGKAQREAVKRARAAKKTSSAKSTVPRGAVRAAYPGTCPGCLKGYGKGEVIAKVTDSWGHPGCATRQLSAAEREYARNKARIEGGETFRGHKPSDWRVGASPSSSRPFR
ncbi:hypothetical protein ACFVUW_10760 [Streptomyces xiamenensis]|uniref:hypothetical protein n=1 Tax=Streptomyces xiamenensis TaxID=408015 RepID=UPI0036E3B1DC